MGRGADGSAVKSQVAPLCGWPEKRSVEELDARIVVRDANDQAR